MGFLLLLLFVCCAAGKFHTPLMFREAILQAQLNQRFLETGTQPGVGFEQYNSSASDRPVCSTPECLAAAVELKESLDLSIDPCQDFYQFACGGWIKAHPVPPSESHLNQFNLVSKTLYTQLRDMLESPSSDEELIPVKNAKKSYAACMDTGRVEEAGLRPLAALLSRHGGWPMAQQPWDQSRFLWQHMSAELMRGWGLSALIFFYVGPDRKNSNISVITIDQPSLVLPRSMLVERAVYSRQLAAYEQWVTRSARLLAKHMEQNISDDAIGQDARDVVQFETELAKLTAPSEMRRDGRRMYNDMTLRQLQQWTDSAAIESPMKWSEARLPPASEAKLHLSPRAEAGLGHKAPRAVF